MFKSVDRCHALATSFKFGRISTDFPVNSYILFFFLPEIDSVVFGVERGL